jgi:hypothetical protein
MTRLRTCLAALLALALLGPTLARAADVKVFGIKPSKIDPAVKHFDDPSIVMLGGGKGAPLVLFLTCTGGNPEMTMAFLNEVARQGYKVISLAYDDVPAVAQVCPQNPDVACSAKFREMRIYGTGGSDVVSNPVNESVQVRLTTLLKALSQVQPDQGWDQFLDGDAPRWDQIVVSGMSQGAGMAAFIAKRSLTRRVVLFSSPWDVAGPEHAPAPWLSDKSATPMDRWYAEYHKREETAALLARAYVVLGIPGDHIWVFSKDLPYNMRNSRSPNPFHVSTIVNEDYAKEWREMFGKASDVVAMQP